MTDAKISDSAVRRLSHYLRLLRELERAGTELVSSRELAERSGATSAQVRKDLSHFGSFGQRGRGYSVPELLDTLRGILGLHRRWRVCLVGVGKIGSALLGYRDLGPRGFDVVAAFDADPDKVGREVFGVTVRPAGELERGVRETQAEIGIIATPPQAAQEVARRLADAGVSAILNFAPVKLVEIPEVAIRTMDVVLELEGLTYLVSQREEARAGEEARDGKAR